MTMNAMGNLVSDLTARAASTATLASGGIFEKFLTFNFRGPSRSAVGDHTDWLYWWIFLLSGFFFLLLTGMMIVFIVRYRKVPGRAPVRSAAHNTLLELSWSVIPTLLLAWMFFEGFYGYANKVVTPITAREVVVSAQKWNWGFTYPNGAAASESMKSRSFDTGNEETQKTAKVYGTQDVPILYVPEKEAVKLRMASVDVIHSFWIPDFRTKFDVMPNRYTSMWFDSDGVDTALAESKGWKLFRTVEVQNDPKNPKDVSLRREPFLDKNGKQYLYNDHWVFCAEYCGSMHSEMLAVIRVVPVEAYEQILIDAAQPKGRDFEKGAALWRTKGCNACHTVDGGLNTGPTWKNIYGEPVEFADGGGLSAEQMTGEGFANYIRESVYEPQKHIVKGYPNQMQSYQGRVSPTELEWLIAYMKSVSEKAPKDGAAETKAETKPEPKAGEKK